METEISIGKIELKCVLFFQSYLPEKHPLIIW